MLPPRLSYRFADATSMSSSGPRDLSSWRVFPNDWARARGLAASPDGNTSLPSTNNLSFTIPAFLLSRLAALSNG